MDGLFEIHPFFSDVLNADGPKRRIHGTAHELIERFNLCSDRVAQLERLEFHLSGFCLGFQPLASQNSLQAQTDVSEPYRFPVQRKRLLHALERTLRFEQPVVGFAHLLGNGGTALGQLGLLELPSQIEYLHPEGRAGIAG